MKAESERNNELKGRADKKNRWIRVEDIPRGI